jgi:hypothetical protein
VAQVRKNDVTPTGQSDKYQVALQDSSGSWIGFQVENFLTDIKGYPLNQSPPQQKLEQMSFHLGRGVERWLSNNFTYFDSKDTWRLTPGKLHGSPLWHWARGMRDHNTNAPGSVVFKPLLAGATLGVSFAASTEYTGAGSFAGTHCWLLIRRKTQAGATGTPGNLTREIRDNTGAVLESVSIAASAVADVTSLWYDFIPVTPPTLTNGTTYWVVIYGSSGDTMDNCWEVGCDITTAGMTAPTAATTWASWSNTTYSPFYRVTDAETARVIWPFRFDSALYALTSNDAGGASKLFINGVRGQATGTQSSTTLGDTGHGTYGATTWPVNRFTGAYIRIIRGTGAGQVRIIASNTATVFTVTAAWTVTPITADSEYVVYASDWWFEIASSFSNPVLSQPAYANGIMYFPMGDSVNIVRMHLDYTDADDHAFASETVANRAAFLASGYISANGPVIWRANNIATAGGAPNGSKVSVARATVASLAWGTDLTFATSILMGDNTQTITNLWVHTNKLYCFKEDSLFAIENDVPVQIKAGIDSYPSRRNGVGVATGTDTQLYVGLRNGLFIIAGALIQDTGMQRDAGIQSSRSGYIADIESVNAWNFCAIDAGDLGTSSIMIYAMDTQTFGEDIRAFAVGKRIRALQWQPSENTNPRLWFECGGELLYQAFPTYDVRPLNDPTSQYMWECVIETSTIDLLSVDPKYFSTLGVVTQNLAQINDTNIGHEIWVEYQMDNYVGTTTWKSAGAFTVSPSDNLALGEGSRRKIRLRFRILTSEVLTPTILERYGLTLISRVPIYNAWSILATLVDDDEEQKSSMVIKWLNDRASVAEKLTMTSINPIYHGKTVVLQNQPVSNIEDYDPNSLDVTGQIFIHVAELA